MTAQTATRPSTRARALLLVSALAVAGALQLLGVSPAVSQTTSLEAMRVRTAPSLDPTDSVWERAPEVEVALSAQRITYPALGGGLRAVRVQAMHDGSNLFMRVSWDDRTSDTRTVGAEDFADAVAVQFPAVAGSSTPAICMGQADQGVNIWHWRADTQGGLPTSVEQLHPNGYVDTYQSTDALYFPAREAGNRYAIPGADPVQDLVAVGFGTLGPAADQTASGRGHWEDDKWSVVISRPFASTDQGRPTFAVGTKTDIAVAAWDGEANDRNGQKAVSPFLQMSITDSVLPAGSPGLVDLLVGVGATAAVVCGLIFGVQHLLYRNWRRST